MAETGSSKKVIVVILVLLVIAVITVLILAMSSIITIPGITPEKETPKVNENKKKDPESTANKKKDPESTANKQEDPAIAAKKALYLTYKDHAVLCASNDPAGKPNEQDLYRYNGDKELRQYPSWAIANTWGQTDGYDKRKLDCTGMTVREPMDYKPGATYKYTGCEADPVTFAECPNGISSGTIKYGRWDNNVCPHGTINADTAIKSETYPLTSGTKSIVGYTYNEMLSSDPFPGVYKQIELEYKC
jgi:hypothetical protein